MPTTLVNIPQSNATGPFSSVPNPGPVLIPADCESITCSLPMPLADQQDSRNSITWNLYVSADGGQTWKLLYGPEAWQGGTHVNHAGQTVANETQFSYGINPEHRGEHLKADGTINRQQRVGVLVVSNP